MYSKMPTKPKICIFFRFGLPTKNKGRENFRICSNLYDIGPIQVAQGLQHNNQSSNLFRLGNFSCFCCLMLTFLKLSISNTYFRNAISVLNSLDPDQGQHSVCPDVRPNCLKRLSGDDKRVKIGEETRVSE